MPPIDIVILVVAAGLVVLSVVFYRIRKKKGKTGCGCDSNICDKCPGCNKHGE